jgi:hypothetical protein
MPFTGHAFTVEAAIESGGKPMASEAGAVRMGNPWRILGWGAAVAIILAPLVAMQLGAPGVVWTLSDFIFAIVLIGGVGLLFELAVRASGSWAYRGGVALALAAAFLLIWINGAVGIIGNEDNPANLVFVAIIAMAVAGAIVAGGKAALMARAMSVAGVAQALVGIAVFAFNDGAEPPGRLGLLLLIEGLAMFWLGSAWLFRKAAGNAR